MVPTTVSASSMEAVPGLCFSNIGVSHALHQRLERVGFTSPSPIQAAAIPVLMAGADLIGQAKTGSGKTGAFIIPIIERFLASADGAALVLVPTRELASQVAAEYQRLSGEKSTSVAVVVGGQSRYRQVETIRKGARLVVATPGRMLDLIQSEGIKFAPSMLVLDEADEMLDMGFIEDIEKILGTLPGSRQTALFSATIPPPIARLAQKHMHSPQQINLNDGGADHVDIEQHLYVVKEQDRKESLLRLIKSDPPTKAIVFCRTKRDADELCQSLIAGHINAKALHGDLRMEARTHTIDGFRRGKIEIIVATDIASRGIDVKDISHVYNYHLPENKDRYVHRIGRTGRAGKKGKAITFASPSQVRSNRLFQQRDRFEIRTVPSRFEVQKAVTGAILADVQSTSPEPVDRVVAEQVLSSADPAELISQFIAHMRKDTRIEGADHLGFPANKALELFKPLPRNRRIPPRNRSATAKHRGRRTQRSVNKR